MKTILFDMDGILINSEPLWKIAEIEAFAKVGLNTKATDFEESVGLRIDEVVQIWHDKVKWTNKTVKAVEDDIVSIVIREIYTQGEEMEGVTDLLKSLKSKGYKIGLATSSYQRIIDAVLDKLKIGDYFDVVHSAEYETFGKPHPAVFMTTADKLKAKYSDCLVFEDSLNGVISAKAARMKVVAVPENSNGSNPKLIIADLILNSLVDFDVDRIDSFFK
jgi:sugar-phosphatase